MFVQVINGKVSDVDEVRARFDTWMSELAPGAIGWLGSTAGVTDDGELVVLARFESAEAAQRNSDRPEQTAWWESTARLFDGEPVFRDSLEVDVDTSGDPDAATFVQVMQGRTSDPDRARRLMAEEPADFSDFRPDVLGSVTAMHEDGEWTTAIYFTSEAEARVNEKKEPPPEMARMMKEMDSLMVGETTYLDLRDPWLVSPG